jgi:hypothetical protein
MLSHVLISLPLAGRVPLGQLDIKLAEEDHRFAFAAVP